MVAAAVSADHRHDDVGEYDVERQGDDGRYEYSLTVVNSSRCYIQKLVVHVGLPSVFRAS